VQIVEEVYFAGLEKCKNHLQKSFAWVFC